ncbi:hypothetical protein CVT24_007687 [Panaeolus cyanescens]|uniref:G domain-containing protein n=1 Tax=Panaeolus cyanescens TaxID=181874 RepID=A0A409VRJ9_9AGAR|nr:hypothetical protein CVT24_007687 [Panaeolus cyanescens]
MKKVNYKHLKDNGNITVKRMDNRPSNINGYQKYLLVGPTGAGKSSFIEAVADDKSLGISKNQLDSVTKAITAYEIINLQHMQDPICLLDSPGFSDNNLSDVEIVNMVKKWMEDNRVFSVSSLESVFYFCPVTDTRLPGSRMKTMEMLKALVRGSATATSSTGSTNEGSVTIITTMWDQVWCERVGQRAESNYTQLKDHVWKVFGSFLSNNLSLANLPTQEMIAMGACMTRFMNTHQSALQIIDQSRGHWGSAHGDAYRLYAEANVPLKETRCGQFLYQDLYNRIENARQRSRTLEFDLQEASDSDDQTLKILLEDGLNHTKYLLKKFEYQLKALEAPSLRRASSRASSDSRGSANSDANVDSASSLASRAPSPVPTVQEEVNPDDEPSKIWHSRQSMELTQGSTSLTPPLSSKTAVNISNPLIESTQSPPQVISSASMSDTVNYIGVVENTTPPRLEQALPVPKSVSLPLVDSRESSEKGQRRKTWGWGTNLFRSRKR